MKKRSIAVRLGIVAMALTMVTTSMSSGTLAKYSAEATGQSAVFIAKWNVSGSFLTPDGGKAVLKKSESTLGELMSASLIGKLDTDGYKAIGQDKATKYKIAPGTYGGFKVVVDPTKNEVGTAGTTEVAVDWVLKINSTGSGLPDNLKFYRGMEKTVEGKTEVKKASESEPAITISANAEVVNSGVIKLDNAGVAQKEEAFIFWEWPYEGEGSEDDKTAYDEKDNSFGTTAKDVTDVKDINNDPIPQLVLTLEMVQHKPGESLENNSLNPTPSPAP